MSKGKLSKKYYKKLFLAILFFALINIYYVLIVIGMHFNFANVFFIILADGIIFLTLISEYVW